jgi:AraC family transcriptional regulator of adaptative response/methylated-DNA-[protein]-cysteine methyltransferase
LLSSRTLAQSVQKGETALEDSVYKQIELAINFLEKNAFNHPSLAEVAAHVGLSAYHFQRLFSSWAGVSPKRFLQYLTVENAKNLLRESASVLETSLAVGLSGPGRLHDLFVSVEAMTPGEYKFEGRKLEISYGFHPTPFGACLVAVSRRGICSLSFVEPEMKAQAVEGLLQSWKEASVVENPEASAGLIRQVFAPGSPLGETPFRILLRGTNFQLKVWDALLRIPEGRVASYGVLAAAVGKPGASRAVGTALGLNPVAYLIPCHRVLRADGGIGGYRWGISRKRAILAREAALREERAELFGLMTG